MHTLFTRLELNFIHTKYNFTNTMTSYSYTYAYQYYSKDLLSTLLHRQEHSKTMGGRLQCVKNLLNEKTHSFQMEHIFTIH